MTEYMIPDATANALGVSPAQADSGLIHTLIGQSPHYTALLQREDWLARVLAFANAGRVYRDVAASTNSLTFGVYAAPALGLSASTGNAMTNNQTNYIYLTAAAALTVNITGFPATWHAPLATIVVAAGDWDMVDDYSDNRDVRVLGVIPYLAFSGTDDADGTGTMDIQAKDAAGNDLAERFRIRTWIADADFSEPDAQTDYSVTVGEQLRQLEANADYEAISTAAGLVTMNIDAGGAKTVYVMAEIDGRIYSTSLAITV